MQGLAPDRVVYMGTVSKTLAPALRLGWLVLPSRLVEPVAGPESLDRPRLSDDRAARARAAVRERRLRSPPAPGAPALSGAPRRAGAAVARHLPGARVTGLAAGLHAIVRLARDVDGMALMRAAGASLGRRLPAGLLLSRGEARPRRPGARLREPRRAGHRRGHPPPGRGPGRDLTAAAGGSARRGEAARTAAHAWDRAPTNDGGAIAR